MTAVDDNLTPVWNESYDFLMCDNDQIVQVEVMDEDGGALDPDDFLGRAQATIGEILLNGGRKEFALVDEDTNKANGAYVTLGCDVVSFSSDLTSLKDTKEGGCFAGVLIILVVGAFDIPLKKEEAKTFVRVSYAEKQFVTGVVELADGVDALNPVYDLAFHLPLTPDMVKNGKMKDLTFSLMNGEKTNLGSTVIKHDEVAAAPENVLTETRPVGKSGAKLHFRVALCGVDRSQKKTGHASRALSSALGASDDFVAVQSPSGGPSTVRITAVSGHGFQIQKAKRLRPLKKADIPDCYCL